MGTAKFISSEEIAKNNGKNGNQVWIIIKNNVCDVTDYLDKHPGGKALMEEWAGKDATKAFEDFGHSSDADNIVKNLKIGELCEEDRKKPKSNTHTNKTFISRITCGLLR